MLNIAVLVSGGGTNLQVLLDAEKAGELAGGKIVRVISSSPDAYALERARLYGVATAVVRRKDYADLDAFDDALLGALAECKPDLIVLAGFMTIFGASVVETYRNRIINVHPALIPSFCGKSFYGLHVHKAVLESGVKLTGATVHLVNEICDGGPIVLQKAVEVLPDDTPEILQQRVMKQAEQKLLPQAVALFCAGKIKVEGNLAKVID